MKSKTFGCDGLPGSWVLSSMAESARLGLLAGRFEASLPRRSKDFCVIVDPLPPELPELPVIADSTESKDGLDLSNDSCLLWKPRDLCLAARRWLIELSSPCRLLFLLSLCLCFRPVSEPVAFCCDRDPTTDSPDSSIKLRLEKKRPALLVRGPRWAFSADALTDVRLDFFLCCFGSSSTSSHSAGLVLVCSCALHSRRPVLGSRLSTSATTAARSVGLDR